ncbi:MAG: polysaccharide pyruvyl transferase CsaB, partial [Thermoanaerobaculaceae bacterium]
MGKVTKKNDASDTRRWRLTQEKPNANRRILLCGYYGFGNLGDEMILEAILQGLRDAGHTITVLAGDPKALMEKYGVQAQSYRDLAVLPELLQSADLVVVGGGGLFQEYWPAQWSTIYRSEHGSLTYYPAIAILAASLGTPVALYGIGVGPVSSAAGKRLIRAAVSSAQYVSVRDAESKRLLEEVGCNASTVQLAADPVFSLSPPPISPKTSARKSLRVGVNLRPWSFTVAQESWEEEVVRGMLQFARSTPIELLLLPFHHSPSPQEADEEVLKRLEAAAQRGGVSVRWARPGNFAEGFQEIGGCDLVVAMRYHTVALAALAGVPFVALVYDPKVAHLARQLRTTETSLPIQDLTAPVLADLLAKVVEEPSLGLPEAGALQELKEAAQADQKRLLALLGQRQSPETSPVADALWVLGRALADAIQEREKRGQEIAQAQQERATVEAEREALARKAARLFEENTSLA